MDTPNQTTKDTCRICEERYYNYGKDGICYDCDKAILSAIANRSAIQHLWIMFICLLGCHFSAALGSLIWAVERTFKVGDYNPKTGEWYTSGVLKRPTK